MLAFMLALPFMLAMCYLCPRIIPDAMGNTLSIAHQSGPEGIVTVFMKHDAKSQGTLLGALEG